MICGMYPFNSFLAAGDRFLFFITSSSLFRISSSRIVESSSNDLSTRALVLMVNVCWSWRLGCGCRISWVEVGGGGNCGRVKLWRVGFKDSNGGIIEVVGRDWCEIIEFQRVGGGGGDTLEIGWFNLWFKLEGESLVLLSSSN